MTKSNDEYITELPDEKYELKQPIPVKIYWNENFFYADDLIDWGLTGVGRDAEEAKKDLSESILGSFQEFDEQGLVSVLEGYIIKKN